MEFLPKYGILILVAIIFIIFIVIKAIKEPKTIKNWLVYACTEAEKILGSGTGKLKLRTVYDMFITQFPVMSILVSFETFSKWVDIALVEMRDMIENNAAIKEVVTSEAEEKN